MGKIIDMKIIQEICVISEMVILKSRKTFKRFVASECTEKFIEIFFLLENFVDNSFYE